jgi:hypothetical protein
MRELFDNERAVVQQLLAAAKLKPLCTNVQYVDVINEDTGTLRSTHLAQKQRLKAVSDTSFSDQDGVHVEVILFVDGDGTFGELLVWKVDDTQVIRMPCTLNEFAPFKAIDR